MTAHNRFALLLGHAAMSVWPDLSQDAQEQLLAAAWTMESSRTPSLSSCMIVIRRRLTQRGLRGPRKGKASRPARQVGQDKKPLSNTPALEF
jgi:hypothetical protein